MQLTNLYFLPQNDDSLLTSLEAKINVLEIMLFFTLETGKALKTFIYENEIGFFDPHVGDTCCQIRAYRVFLLSKSLPYEYKSFLQNMEKIVEKLKIQISFLTNFLGNQRIAEKEMIHKSQKLHNFFSENGLIFAVSKDIFFLTSSLFLTRFKSIDTWGNTHINLDAVEKQIGVSRKLAKKIVRDHQLKLAADSISFIEYLQKSPACSFLSSFKFSHLIKNDDNGRKVLPCYLIIKFLFNHMTHQKTPILFIINRKVKNRPLDTVFIIFINARNYIHLTEDSALSCDYMDSTAIVIEGLVEYPEENDIETQKSYIKRLSKAGVETTIFANMAYHPQYSGQTLAYLNSSPFNHNTSIEPNNNAENSNIKSHKNEKDICRELKEMQEIAVSIGCCDVNRSLFFIRHIYCDIISNSCSQICFESVA